MITQGLLDGILTTLFSVAIALTRIASYLEVMAGHFQ